MFAGWLATETVGKVSSTDAPTEWEEINLKSNLI